MKRVILGTSAVVLLGAALLVLQTTASTHVASAATAGGTASAPPSDPGEPPAQTNELRIVALPSLDKLRPDRVPEGSDRIELRALRGECEAAQVAIGAGASKRTITAAKVDPIPGVELRLSRVDLVELQRPSGPEGASGRWPDPLVPAVDAYLAEKRNAFPFEVPPRESRAIWVEACVAAGAKAGLHQQNLVVTVDGTQHTVPLAIRVERDLLPATATLPTSFGFSAIRAAIGHYGRKGTPEELRELDRLYRTALLRHRISVHGGTMDPPPFRRVGGKLQLDFRSYDEEIGPFLEGKVLPSGAKATTVELRTHPALQSDEERIAYWRAIAEHHRNKGWGAVLFDYAKDEPRREDLPAVATRARLVKRADPRIRVLLTASLDPSLADVVDLWTPNLNCLYVKKRPDEFCSWRAPRASYKADIWWYQSCSSHGCDQGPMPTTGGDYFRGWPTYVVDAPSSRARAMGWLAFSEGIGGELYWDTVYAYAPEGTRVDPFAPGKLWAFGGNGDGTFFYPGDPKRIGGTHHVPLESIRLALVRDGLEDYELLRLVASRPGGEALAKEVARSVAPAPYRVADDPAAIRQGRERLLDFLAGAFSSDGAPSAGGTVAPAPAGGKE